MIIDRFRYYFQKKDLLLVFIRKDLKSRYAGSYLGIFWSVLNPLLMLLTFTFVFSVILKIEFQAQQGILNYALYVFCGMLPWLAIQESISRSTSSLIENASLVKQAHFPTSILPTHLAIAGVINEFFGLLVLIIAVVISSYHLSSHLLLLPLIILLQIIFTLGLCWFLAALNVFFRDTVHFLNVGMMIWMFVTPIFYPSSTYPPKLEFLLVFNPLAHLVDIYRELILNNHWPQAASLAGLALMSAVVCGVGYFFFSRSQPRFNDFI